MASAEVEHYRQLEQDYARALAEYQADEAAYRDAVSRDEDSPELKAKYQELAKKRQALEQLFERLREIRKDAAHARDEALRKFAF